MTGSVKEITKLEKTSLSDFTLCGAELFHTEESLMRFFQTCTDSLIVCAGCVGMSGRVKEITKLARTSLSDFTLCGAELLHKLLKQL